MSTDGARQAVRDESLASFGARVRQLRKAAGLTQEALGLASGVHRVTLVQVEAGQHELGVTRVLPLATALGVTPNELFLGGMAD